MLALIKEKLPDACVREACALRPRRHSELSVLPVSQFHPCRYGPSGLIRVERSPAGGGFYEASIVQNILQHPGRSISTQWSRHCTRHQGGEAEDSGFPQASVHIHRQIGRASCRETQYHSELE